MTLHSKFCQWIFGRKMSLVLTRTAIVWRRWQLACHSKRSRSIKGPQRQKANISKNDISWRNRRTKHMNKINQRLFKIQKCCMFMNRQVAVFMRKQQRQHSHVRACGLCCCHLPSMYKFECSLVSVDTVLSRKVSGWQQEGYGTLKEIYGPTEENCIIFCSFGTFFRAAASPVFRDFSVEYITWAKKKRKKKAGCSFFPFPEEKKITSEHKENASVAWHAAYSVIITSKSSSEWAS